MNMITNQESSNSGLPPLISRRISLDLAKEPNNAGMPTLITRRTSLDCAKERLENGRSMLLQRRLSLNTTEECRKPRASLSTHRRVSCDIPKEEPGYAKDLATRRRVSSDIGKRSNLLRSGSIPPTNNEETQGDLQRQDSKLPELSTNDALREKLQQRRYTVINAPAQLHVQKKHPMKKQRSQPAFETTVCQLASKTSNTLSLEQEVDESDANEINMDVNFVPKPCWCLRCQIMLSMFRTGDKHLEVWGNYPCFRR